MHLRAGFVTHLRATILMARDRLAMPARATAYAALVTASVMAAAACGTSTASANTATRPSPSRQARSVILRSFVRAPRAYAYIGHTRTDDHPTQPEEGVIVPSAHPRACLHVTGGDETTGQPHGITRMERR
jgi:hypothetical protein